MILSSFPSKHWNPGPVCFIHVGIIILSFQTLESWPYNLYYTLEFSPHPFKHWNFAPIICYNHWNSGPIVRNMGIFVIPSTANIEILALSFKTLEFSSYLYKHCNSHLILPNTLILALFLYTLEFWPHPSKFWDYGPVFIRIGILALFLQTWEFLSSLSTGNIEILALSFKTLEFSS